MAHSKYYNLDLVEDGWTREEQDFAILTLEALPEQRLLELLDVFGIAFEGGNANEDEDQIIAAILTDSTKEELLSQLGYKADGERINSIRGTGA